MDPQESLVPTAMDFQHWGVTVTSEHRHKTHGTQGTDCTVRHVRSSKEFISRFFSNLSQSKCLRTVFTTSWGQLWNHQAKTNQNHQNWLFAFDVFFSYKPRLAEGRCGVRGGNVCNQGWSAVGRWRYEDCPVRGVKVKMDGWMDRKGPIKNDISWSNLAKGLKN